MCELVTSELLNRDRLLLFRFQQHYAMPISHGEPNANHFKPLPNAHETEVRSIQLVHSIN